MMWVEKCDNKEVGVMRVRRRDRRIWFMALSIFFAVFLFTFLRQNFSSTDEAEAANLANFDPGYIISDYQMGNYSSMTEAEIQAFLTTKNPCNNTNQSDYEFLTERYPSIKWHFENGHFICLSEELFGDGEIIGEGETAAKIIWQAAQDYKINPQVLIVMVQKEQGLVTDTYPNSRQYRSATGYGCPDTAACLEKYYGFKNQVRNAAAMFRAVLDGGWTNYPLGENYIQYNPNAACGGSIVNVRNLATSALYRYTPYQPNEGALAAGYGTAYCGSYGNRNFYHYFEDWFGGILSDGIIYDKVDYSGEYNILYAGDHSKMISVDNNNVVVKKVDKGAEVSQWEIKKVEDYYIVTNKKTGKILSVEGGAFEKKTNVSQSSDDSCAGRWNFVKNADGTITIHNVCSSKYVLDLQDGNSNVQIYTKTDYDNIHQEWLLQPADLVDLDEGAYYLKTSDGGKFVAVFENNVSDGANVQADIYKNTDGSRHWTIKKTKGEDYYTIENSESGFLLGVDGGVVKNKSNVKLCAKTNSNCLVYWFIEKYDENGYFIRNVSNITFVLDLQNGDTNVQIYTKTTNLNDHQKWILEKEDDLDDFGGIYNIVYAGNRAKVLGVGADENVIASWQKNGDASQKWQVEKVDDYYLIKNIGTGKVIDISGGVLQNRTNIWQHKLNSSCAQRWKFDKNMDGTVAIYNACDDNFVLDVHNGDTNVQIYTRTRYENDHQKWILSEVKEKDYSGQYQIIYYGDQEKALTVANASSENYANVLVKRAVNGEASYLWTVEKVDDYYTIKNNKTQKLLDVEYGKFANKVNVWQYALNKTCAQRWQFIEDASGTVMIQNACAPSFVLDVQDGLTNVQIYTRTSYENNHQRWLLKVPE